MGSECSAGIDLRESSVDLRTYALDDLVLVEKIHLTLCRMYVHIHTSRIDIQAEIDERVTPFRKESGVCLLYRLFDCRRLDGTMVDEE